MTPLVSVAELAEHLDDPDVRLCDVRWYLGEPGRGRTEYERAHLPGSMFVDLEGDLSGSGGPGRHPLPDPAAFGALLGRLGITPPSRVVAYDATAGSVAARLWWMLRSIGHASVQVLDGGLPTWVDHGLPLTDEVPEPRPAVYPTPRTWSGVVDAEEVGRRLGRSHLVDARAPERYRGEVEPVDPRAGHLPTAINLPHAGNVAGDGRLLPASTLRERFARVAGPETIVYCGSGVTACHDILAMVAAGLPQPLLYPGSWSDWCSLPSRPIASGSAPGGPLP